MADLTLEELKRLHDQNFQANQVTRERAADDRVFSRVSQWDDGLLSDSQLQYRGEFNLIRKATRKIIADLRSNPIQIDFVPLDDERDDGAELIDGLYLTEDRRNSTLESYDNAALECVDCGVGGWELFTEYQTNNAGDRNQVIRRRPIYEANNNSFPDANAKSLDKSDARNWSILEPFTKDGYQELYEELTGNTTTGAPANFSSPEQSYTFPWISGQNQLFYIVRFYHRTKIKDKVLTFADPMGQELLLRESDLMKAGENSDVSIMDELIEQGYEIVSEKSIKRWQVKRYIASGEEILKVEDVPGTHIPVVHTYGEHTFVEGEEIWEGVVRLAKDPQRLRNFMLSYLADIVSRSPRPKPIFFPEQIAGFESMYEETGADNNYPYYLQQRKDASGADLPMGPAGMMPTADLPQGMRDLAAETREAVKDVADPGLPDNFADPAMSGYAMEQMRAEFDMQSVVYQQNLKFAKRWDAVIYAGMSSIIFDSPRKVTVTRPDGERESVEIMETILDKESGELVVLNDLTNQEFEVFAEVGHSYTSKKEKTRVELRELANQFAATDPQMHRALSLKGLMLIDGVDLDDIRDYGNKQLLLGGFKEPTTDEDIAFMEQAANKEQEPDPAMVLAMAEQGKAEAQMMREQRMSMSDQARAQNDQGKLQIDAFRAETDRNSVEVDAAEAGVNIEFTQAKTMDVKADTMEKMGDRFRSRSKPAPVRQEPTFEYDPMTGELSRSA